MKVPASKTGWALAVLYLAICIYLIISQGLFGESFIALLLGLPWSLLFAYFEYGGALQPMLYMLVLAPIALNTAIFYWLGSFLEASSRHNK